MLGEVGIIKPAFGRTERPHIRFLRLACARHGPTKRRGEVAEAAFLLKAATLGFSVAKPSGESDRYDFILDNGARTWRVQVKSAHCDGKTGYSLHACGNVQSRTYTAADIDFFVAYIVP